MIHFFTDPYKDELIYSAIARYHYYTGNLDCKDTLEELFGKRTVIPSLEIGSYLDVLAQNLGSNYNADSIIQNHTIYPFYSPFLPKDRKEELLEEIKHSDGSGLYTKLGMVAGSICKKEGIYYCPCCAKKDIDDYGEAYIHREHQLQGVFICPQDGAELKKYSVDKTNSSRIEFIRLDKKLLDLRDIRAIDDKNYDKLYKISRDAYYLLQADLEDVSKDMILEKYKNMLYGKGLTTTSKRVKQRKLYEEFIGFYGEEFLKYMESSIDNDDEYNWLRVITRDLSRTVHPIRHVLMINFLCGDMETFLKDIKTKFNPFGDGPWPCLNRASDHYRRNKVRDLKITEDYKTRVPVGTFTCECGFVYSRRGPDKSYDDRYKVGRIKSFGVVWENKLREYLKEEKYGLRELARLMNCDPKTILKFKDIFSQEGIKNDKPIEEKEQSNNFIEEYKNNLLQCIESNPQATRTEIRELCKKEYTYLYRQDKEWLYSNLPEKTVKINENRVVDWDVRDDEILKKVKNAYIELLNDDNPIRISKSSIGKVSGVIAALEKNLDKLPKTKAYLDKVIETTEEFQVRRCKNIIDEKTKNDEEIKLWELKRAAGIRDVAFEKIKNEILDYINEKERWGNYGKGSS